MAKKKTVKRIKTEKKVNHFKIIITVNNKQKKFVGFYRGEKKAYEAFNKIKEENEKIKIPVEISTSTIAKPINYEVIMFYTFNIPMFGNIATFEVKGTTIDLNNKNYYKYFWSI